MKTVHVKTPSGFEADIEKAALDDYAFTELVAAYIGGQGFALPRMVDWLLTPEDKKRLLDHLRGEDGHVTTDAVSAEFLEIIRAARKN